MYDECSEAQTDKVIKCQANASCINCQVSYNCFWKPNYVSDGFICEGTFDFFSIFKAGVR